MTKSMLALLLLLVACGKPAPAAPPVQVVDDAPEVATLTGVGGAEDWRACLGKIVGRMPDGTLAVGPRGTTVGTVVKWLAPGKVEVEMPMR